MNLQLEVKDLGKTYGTTMVLDGTSFCFSKSGTYVLMGENGSGKSTLLRICALLEKPDRGSLTYRTDGAVLSEDIRLKRRISLVLPRIGVFNLSVLQNVLYGLKLRGIERNESLAKAEAAIDFVGLGSRKGQNALTLSSGETQRLGLARALAIDPEILFLDEPAAFVDTRNRDIIEEIILTLGRNGKRTVILTTHDPRQATRLSDRLILMKDGRLTPP